MMNALLAALLAAQDTGELIDRLRSDLIEEREAAVEGLRALGPKALQALEAVLDDPDPEVAVRARALWARLPFGNARETVQLPKRKLSIELAEIPAGRRALRWDPERTTPTAFALSPFWIGTREVTWKEFEAYRTARDVDGLTRPSDFTAWMTPDGKTGPGFPVHYAGWYSGAGYAEWLSRETGHYYRLPTEAEWEVAARGGLDGDRLLGQGDFAWSAANANGSVQAVGRKAPNRFGLHDVLGNVREYALEPFRPGEWGPVVRGGGWTSPDAEVTFSARDPVQPAWWESDPTRPRSLWNLTDAPFVGFRVVRVPGAAGEVERDAYAKKLEVTILRTLDLAPQARRMGNHFTRVWGEVANRGERTVRELELAVAALDAGGRLLWRDEDGGSGFPGRPVFNRVYPVLPNSAWAGEGAAPLPPKGRRGFVVDVPQAFDAAAVAPPPFGARVSQVCLSD
jgi:sulfatase modifying factor 1